MEETIEEANLHSDDIDIEENRRSLERGGANQYVTYTTFSRMTDQASVFGGCKIDSVAGGNAQVMLIERGSVQKLTFIQIDIY